MIYIYSKIQVALEEIMKWYFNTHVGKKMCYLTLNIHVMLDGEWIFFLSIHVSN